MEKMSKMEMMEFVRAFGEIHSILKETDNDMIAWVMRIGEARNILNNCLIQTRAVWDIMRELQHNIPQFHKQPGSFKELEIQLNHIIGTLHAVNKRLSYVQDDKVESEGDDREDSDREYEQGDDE